MSDTYLPPGVTARELYRYLDGPRKLRCIGCGLDFPTEQLDDGELCAECVRDRINEDDPRNER